VIDWISNASSHIYVVVSRRALQVLRPDNHGKPKCVTVHFGKLWTTDLDNFGRHSRSGFHFPNTIGYIICSQSPGRKGCCANERDLSSIPTRAKAKQGCSKSSLVNLLECRSHQRQPTERKKSLSARILRKNKKGVGTQRRKSMLWALEDESHLGRHWKEQESS